MSQTWHIPLLTTDALSDSRGYINDALASLQSMFSGTAAPSSPVKGQLFYDTDDDNVYIYNGSAWKIIGGASVDYLNNLPRVAGSSYPLGGDLYMGTHQVKGVSDPTLSTDAVSKNYGDTTYLALAGGTMAGDIAMGANDITMDHNPSAATDLVRKAYADLFLPKAGGAMTGDLDMGSHALSGLPSPASASAAAPRSYVDDKFDTGEGHHHDSIDSRKVPWVSLDSDTATAGQIITANGSGGITVSAPVAIAAGATAASVSIGTSATVMASADAIVPSAAAKVAVLCTAIVSGLVDTDLFANIKRGATTIVSGAGCWSCPSNGAVSTVTVACDDSPGAAGTYAYSFEFYRTGGAASATNRVIIPMVHV